MSSSPDTANVIDSTKPKSVYAKLKDSYQFCILFVLCAVFVCLKIPNLKIPFFWDEAWVYAPGIKVMAKSGASLLPHALADSYSRGHPLLFYCMGAIWVNLFGNSTFSIHLFALGIAVSFAFTLFYIVKKIFDPTLALIVTAITLTLPNFFAQSAIAVPEIFLSLWAILTIYHFVKGNKYYYFLVGTLMMLTKESGIAIIATLMLYPFICFITQKRILPSFKVFIQSSFFAFTPLFSFIAFLIVQHYQRGYYLFPEHLSLLNFNWHAFQETLKGCYDYLFEGQNRIFITWSFLIAFGLLYKPMPFIIRCFIVLGLMTCVKIFFRYWALPDWLMIIVIGLFTSIFYYLMHIKYAPEQKESNKFLAILFLFGIVYLIFSSINFITGRYLFILAPLLVLYFSYYIKIALRFHPVLPYCWAALIMGALVYYSIKICTNTGDESPRYIDSIKLEQQMVKYLEDQNLQKDSIYCKFTMEIALKDTGVGFLSGKPFSNVNGSLDKNTEYVIYNNVDYDTLWIHGSDSLPQFQIIKTFNYGVANGKLFKRRD
jgi:4-amino-4-deoxy-L-arabinose transferase-like glycosyltransferase